jgi:hypothetical protein
MKGYGVFGEKKGSGVFDMLSRMGLILVTPCAFRGRHLRATHSCLL